MPRAQDASGTWGGCIRSRWLRSITPTQIRVWLLRNAGFRVCGERQNLYVYSLYRNPDLENWIFDCLLASMAAVQAEDVRASFLFVGDLNGQNHEWLGSTPTNRHRVAAFDFATVSGCDHLVVGPTYARGGTLDLLITDVPDLTQDLTPLCQQLFRRLREFQTCV